MRRSGQQTTQEALIAQGYFGSAPFNPEYALPILFLLRFKYLSETSNLSLYAYIRGLHRYHQANTHIKYCLIIHADVRKLKLPWRAKVYQRAAYAYSAFCEVMTLVNKWKRQVIGPDLRCPACQYTVQPFPWPRGLHDLSPLSTA